MTHSSKGAIIVAAHETETCETRHANAETHRAAPRLLHSYSPVVARESDNR